MSMSSMWILDSCLDSSIDSEVVPLIWASYFCCISISLCAALIYIALGKFADAFLVIHVVRGYDLLHV